MIRSGSRPIRHYRESERPFSCSTSSDWSPAISPASFSRSRYDTIGSSTARLLLRRTDTWLCCGRKASPESPLKSNGATGFRRTYGITVVNERRTRGALPRPPPASRVLSARYRHERFKASHLRTVALYDFAIVTDKANCVYLCRSMVRWQFRANHNSAVRFVQLLFREPAPVPEPPRQ